MTPTDQSSGTTMLTNRLKNLSPSATLVMADKARELQNQGIDVIKLNLGEPDFATPEHVCQAAKDAIDEGKWFGYSPVPGYPDLRSGIAEKFKRDNNLEYTANNIVVSTGAKQSLSNLLNVLCEDGDEVVIFTPYWVTYIEQVRLTGAKPVLVAATIDNDFKVTAEQLKAAITPRTKAIMYSSPSNPTGAVLSKEDLESYAEVIRGKDIMVIADEIYEYINFGGTHTSMAEIEGMKDQTVIVNGFSKGFAMTGWRLGYIAAPEWLAKACIKFQGQTTSGTCSIAQRAAVTAVKGDLDAAYSMRDAYLRRRDLVKNLLDEIEGIKTNVPDGAFYIFPDVSAFFGKTTPDGTSISDSHDLAMYLLNEAHVSLVDGGGFGAPQCMRISFAASDEQLKEAIKRISGALSKLK